jgi:hypothetical protein
MFESLDVAIKELETPTDCHSMIEFLRLRDRFEAKIAHIITEFEATQQ